MNIWSVIIDWIRKLFGVSPLISNRDGQRNNAYVNAYEDTERINFTAIISSKLAALIASESAAAVIPSGESTQTTRIDLLNEVLERLWAKSRKFTARLLGIGGIVIVPYVSGGKIYMDIVPQNRVIVTKIRGDQIVGVTILADSITRNDSLSGGGKRYYRWTDYQLDASGVHLIRNRATSQDSMISLDAIEEWAGIPDELRINGVDRLLFSFIKSPVDNRQVQDLYGVPVTYGCDGIIKEIQETLAQVRQEFELKRSFVGVDERLFGKDNRLPGNGLFRFLTGSTNDNLWEIFDPAFRDSSYHNRLDNLFGLLEKQIGVSRGILTKPESRGATATEIKAGIYDTYSLVEATRDSIERGIEDFVYACNVLANAYQLSPSGGDYEVRIDWSYALIESSAETFTQYLQGEAVGAIEAAEIRQYLMTDETLEEARARVEEIKTAKRSLGAELLSRSLTEDAQGLGQDVPIHEG